MSPKLDAKKRLHTLLVKGGWDLICRDNGNQLLVLKNGTTYQVHFKSRTKGKFCVSGSKLELKYCPEPPCDR